MQKANKKEITYAEAESQIDELLSRQKRQTHPSDLVEDQLDSKDKSSEEVSVAFVFLQKKNAPNT